jgi:hypothetical protein
MSLSVDTAHNRKTAYYRNIYSEEQRSFGLGDLTTDELTCFGGVLLIVTKHWIHGNNRLLPFSFYHNSQSY